MSKDFRIFARMQVNMTTKELRSQSYRFGEGFAAQIGELTLAAAKRNVAPGKGPGPHPHITEHEDTGYLMEHIFVKPRRAGFMIYSHVYTDVEYGTYLEIGWHTSLGKFVRYPWLAPAAEEAKREALKIARQTYRIYFKPGGGKGFIKGKIESGGPVFATLPRAT